MPEDPLFAESPEVATDSSLFPGKYGYTAEQQELCVSASKKIQEEVVPALEKMFKKVIDEAWDNISDYINGEFQNDNDYNFRRMVDDKVRYIIIGLLAGGWAEAESKSWLYEFDFKEFRHKAYMANREHLENQVIEDLRKENSKLQADNESYRESLFGRLNGWHSEAR